MAKWKRSQMSRPVAVRSRTRGTAAWPALPWPRRPWPRRHAPPVIWLARSANGLPIACARCARWVSCFEAPCTAWLALPDTDDAADDADDDAAARCADVCSDEVMLAAPLPPLRRAPVRSEEKSMVTCRSSGGGSDDDKAVAVRTTATTAW